MNALKSCRFGQLHKQIMKRASENGHLRYSFRTGSSSCFYFVCTIIVVAGRSCDRCCGRVKEEKNEEKEKVQEVVDGKEHGA